MSLSISRNLDRNAIEGKIDTFLTEQCISTQKEEDEGRAVLVNLHGRFFQEPVQYCIYARPKRSCTSAKIQEFVRTLFEEQCPPLECGEWYHLSFVIISNVGRETARGDFHAFDYFRCANVFCDSLHLDQHVFPNERPDAAGNFSCRLERATEATEEKE